MTAPDDAGRPGTRGVGRADAGSRRLAFVAEVAVPVAYVALTLLFSTHLRRFEGEPDEGFNLAKAALVARGHALYDEVWSDQPPLLTEMLRALFAVTGESVLAARLLVLAFSGVLLWACARTARLAGGPREALAAPLLLLVVPPFQRLSVSVMIGLPAIAFGAVALVFGARSRASGRAAWAAASGVLLALGVLTKLFVALLAPIALAGVVLGAPRGSRTRPAFAWCVGFALTAALGFLAFASPRALEQLVAPHLAAATDPGIRSDSTFGFLAQARGAWWLGLLAVAGAAVSLRRRSTAGVALAWAVVALVALSLHRPVWPHHLLLLTVPAAVLASPAAVAGADVLLRFAGARVPGRRALRTVAALGAAVGAAWLVADAGRWRRPRPPGDGLRRDEALVDGLRSLALPGDAILTDRPIYAFRAGVPVLPETAVFSAKRLWTGHLTEDGLLDLVDRRRPALVLLERFRLPAVRAELRTRYRLVHRRGTRELYVEDAPGRPSPSCAWPDCLGRPDAWYGGPEAQRLAEHVLEAQNADGGWAKDDDYGFAWVRGREDRPCDGVRLERCSSIDNDATTTEMRFLARLHASAASPRLAEAFLRGLDHLLGAQTPSGGWPQVPGARAGSYPAAITLNDDAMAHVMDLLADVAHDPAYAFVDAGRRERARAAFDRGVSCLVRAQIRVGDVPTAWCAQHDRATLAPVAARSYEPPSLSGHESVGAVRVLMRVGRPAPDVVSAVEAAVRWFRAARIEDPGGAPRWARFYDLDTSAPIFPDLDGAVHASFDDLSEERKTGYRYFTDAPRALLEAEYPRWRSRVDGIR